ncbi:hypothetical protein SAMN02910265_02869 [Ruminococcus flavefaciens]|uniref:Dockerin domain-containing protein n=1 Tax=Ruminococcus flavefaciens TaxID=1265 RepID=A0A1H6LB09_RUMFL|nr:hypothetical protein [Ruminococcus flavefaciens]SEH81791.1 hypothetical protein SAMN02910265_02869 [Ruminococcus flavefaciens]
MKKFISIITSVLTVFSASSLTAFADGSLDFSDDLITHKTNTRIVGDLKEDGEISVGDLVIMAHIMHGNRSDADGRYYYDELGYSDLNFDLSTDIFDIIELRKLVISPEKAFKIVSDADILSSANKASNVAAFIRSPEDITSYLSGIGTSEEEIQQYLDIYDDDFFKDSDVVFGTLVQEYGNGIHFRYPEASFMVGKFAEVFEVTEESKYEQAAELLNVDIETLKNSNIYTLITYQEYNTHPMLYPKTDKVILFRTTVPKSIYDQSNGIGLVWDFELFVPEYRAHAFDSPDGKHHIYITAVEDDFMDDSCTYMFFNINNDGSYKYYGEYYDYYDLDKFNCDYILTTDGMFPAYKFGDNVRIVWADSFAIIEFQVDEWDDKYEDYRKEWKYAATIDFD